MSSKETGRVGKMEVDSDMKSDPKTEAKVESKCGSCQKKVTTTGVLCEVCGFWFHCKCQQVSDQLYDTLNTYQKEVHWYCSSCREGVAKILTDVLKLESRIDKIDKKLDADLLKITADWNQEILKFKVELQKQWQTELEESQKAVNDKLTEGKQKITSLEKIEDQITGITARLANIDIRLSGGTKAAAEEPLWSDTARKSKVMDHKLVEMGIEVQMLQKQKSDIQQDREEQEELNKHRNCVIIHGLTETSGGNTDEKKKAKLDGVEELLHQITCDNVSVNTCFRLGKMFADPLSKPRPMKLTLVSEAKKQQVLQSAKNLKTMSNKLGKVFIHQDLTPKPRERRQLLVKELKERKEKDEQNLIIVDNSMVVRRPKRN